MKTWHRFLDALLGPSCPYGCGYRARGWRSLAAHIDLDHAGDPEQQVAR